MLTNQLELPTEKGGRDIILTVQWGNPTPTIWDITQIPTYNEPGVLSLSIEDRRCRFPAEADNLFLLKTYNYHACMLETQIKKFNESCGCVGHLFPYSDKFKTCNSTELKCGFENRDAIVQVENDNCLPDCEEIIVIQDRNTLDEDNIPAWAVTKLEFNMLPGPFTRYERYTVFSLLDVVGKKYLLNLIIIFIKFIKFKFQ